MSLENACCSSCHLLLKDPLIECAQCDPKVLLCVDCASKGRQFVTHVNTHPYRVVHRKFSVLDPDWTAEEEEMLLTLLIQRGEGNWDDIAKVGWFLALFS